MKSDTLYQISRIPLKIQFPHSSRVLTSAFAQCNPPRSLWLQLVHRTGCFTRRAHIAVPPLHKFEGTHGDRVAGDNTDAIDFVAIASSLRATNGRRAVGNTNRLKAVPPSFVRRLRTHTAQSDDTTRRASTLAFLAALRLVFRLRMSDERV